MAETQLCTAVLLLVIILASTTHACSDTDYMALQYFKQEIVFGGEEFKTWSVGTNCCIWDGVNCNSDGRVQDLNVVGRYDSATYPPSATSYEVGRGLADLDALQTLTLVNISFYGLLPATWSNLVHLRILHVESCAAVGNLPPEYCNFRSLNALNLKDNYLNGTVPSCIYNKNLSEIELDGNSFS